MDTERPGDIEQTIRLVRIEEQHGAGVAPVAPLRFGQHRRVRRHLQIVAAISTGGKIDGPADRAGRIECLRDRSAEMTGATGDPNGFAGKRV